MTEYEFDLSTVDSIEVEANNGDEAIERLHEAIEDRIEQGTIQANEVRTFDVKAQATGCIYRVAGMNAAEAEDNLHAFLKQQKQALQENVRHGDEGYGLICDLSTGAETIEEVEGSADIGRDGREQY